MLHGKHITGGGKDNNSTSCIWLDMNTWNIKFASIFNMYLKSQIERKGEEHYTNLNLKT
jgi:hypothetical protein